MKTYLLISILVSMFLIGLYYYQGNIKTMIIWALIAIIQCFVLLIDKSDDELKKK